MHYQDPTEISITICKALVEAAFLTTDKFEANLAPNQLVSSYRKHSQKSK